MDWLKLYAQKWIFGSGRLMTAEKRGIWADLLALASMAKLRDGTLRHDVNQPMDRDYIVTILKITREQLDSALAAFQADVNTDDGKSRVSIWDDGTIELTNFERYQAVPDQHKRLKGHELELAQRLQLNKLGAKYPIEALNVPEVKKIIEGELGEKDST